MNTLTLIKLIIFDKNDDQFDKIVDQFDKNDDQFDINGVRIINTRRDLYNITFEQALVSTFMISKTGTTAYL